MDEKVYNDILNITTTYCETCKNRESCLEEECPIRRIEYICENQDKHCGTYQCFHCLSNAVGWESDFDFEDFGLEGEGIVHVCHCSNCNATIEYYVPVDEIEE